MPATQRPSPSVSFNGTAGTLGTALTATMAVLNASGTFTYTVNEGDAAVQALRQSTNTITDFFSYTMRRGRRHRLGDADCDTLRYVATTAGGSTLLAWLSFNASARTFSDTPTSADEPMSARDPGDGDRSRRPRANETFNIAVSTAPTSYSLFSPSGTPAQTSLNDGPQLEVGLKFQANVAGQITALKFYRSPSDTGQNVVELWTATGTKLASASCTKTAASGWKTVALDACFHTRQHNLCRVLPHDRDLCCH